MNETDTGTDLITEEFLHLLFFKQCNLVIFPYLDLRHLRVLEVFVPGFQIITLECTALFNVKEILEMELVNSYSHQTNFYFIYNVSKEEVLDLTTLKGLRCVLNTPQKPPDLGNGSIFKFYDKKTKQFLNFSPNPNDLLLEREMLGKTGTSITLLQEELQKIVQCANKIFTALVEGSGLNTIAQALSPFPQIHWDKILEFCHLYKNIEVPSVSEILNKSHVAVDYTEEYELIKSLPSIIRKEFIRCLNHYRSRKVNQSNLEFEDLYDPTRTYNYLRNHHWKDGFPEDFLWDWSSMTHTNFILSKDQIDLFKTRLSELGVTPDLIEKLNFPTTSTENINAKEKLIDSNDNAPPEIISSFVPEVNVQQDTPEKQNFNKNLQFKDLRGRIIELLDLIERKLHN